MDHAFRFETQSSLPRILIIDDHPLVRQGVGQVLQSRMPCLIGECADASEGFDAVRNEPWDLVLLDLSMPGKTGLEAIKGIKEIRPELPILVFSAYTAEQFAKRVFRAGAVGYVTKGSSPGALADAVQKTLGCGKNVPPSLAEELSSTLAQVPSGPAHELLSNREYDVMLRIASGCTVGEIARELDLSVKTVSTYRSRILQKMGSNNNSDLVQYAFRNNLIR